MKVIFLFTLITIQNHTLPMADEFYKEGPSQEDYAKGSFIRYFVERRNDPK